METGVDNRGHFAIEARVPEATAFPVQSLLKAA
jgi:hypothetical protein